MTIKETLHKGVLTPTNKQQYKDLMCSLYYDKDRKRYWASIMPCAKSDWAMECSPFDGKSEIILKVQNRRSTKTDAQAIAIFDASQPRYLTMFRTAEENLKAAEQPSIPPTSPEQETATA